MKSVRFGLLLAGLSLSGLAAAQQQDPAALFGARQRVASISLSPDGERVSYVMPAQGQGANLYVVDLEGGRAQLAASSDGQQQLGGCDFVSRDRLVCNIYAVIDLDGDLAPMQRLIAVNADGSNPRQLGQRRSTRQLGIRLSSGRILDFLPGENNSVLMTQTFMPEDSTGTRLASSAEGLGVVRLDTATLRSRGVEPARPNAVHYISDGLGNVRIMISQGIRGATGMDSGQQRISYRRAGSEAWEPFGTYDINNDEGMYPVAVDAALNVAYAFEKLNGRQALYRVALDGSGRRELVLSNDRVDVTGLLRVGRRKRVVGASFATERREVVYFDTELRQIADRLHRALPNLPMIRFVDASEDESKLLILASSDTDPGRYYIYEKATRQLREILLVRPELENVPLAPMRAITYRAADGTEIPAYLTLPVGGAGRGLPAIVMPHGGPGARDEWGFDWLVQFYANRGYAVIQPNFRGSAGYGEEWFQENGFRSWRTAIGDVNDAGRWLVAEGIADPAKLAIVGWSYGGYAALQANVLDPALFKAAVAIAPVTDLEVARSEWSGWTNAANVRDYFGSGAHIREGSPAQNAGAIQVPVLMFHGDLDRNVGVRQARLMDERLREAGRRSELVIFPGLDHQLEDSQARADMLRRSDAFLREAMGIR